MPMASLVLSKSSYSHEHAGVTAGFSDNLTQITII